MKNKKQKLIIVPEKIESKIFFIRGKKVMLDRDLAGLYEVETKVLNQAVKRNRERFPTDFMFQLNKQESVHFLRSQFVTSNRGGQRYDSYAFTEQGVAMLSSVLRSKRAIQANIQIMRTFTRMRELIASNKELREKIEKLENKYDQQFRVVFEAIRKLLEPPLTPQRRIGFNVIQKECATLS